MDEALRKAALDYHEFPVPGKISVTPTKAMVTQRDLALAYSPGVAAPCQEIERDPSTAAKYTARGNLVAVITNGTAVLGLGNIGPLASKPVMEGKGVLFKKFAGVDVFDIEIDENDPDKIVEIVAALEPTFGGINLEDIKAPECFYIEKKLRERMKIPVFHDDQHGTSIIVGSALLNALKIVGKKIEDIRIVCSGAGAAAIACLDILVSLGAKRENILVVDSKGVCYEGRPGMDESKAKYAQNTTARVLADALPGADMFLGLSTAGVLKADMIKDMAKDPLIFALANPTPEIMPELAQEARPDAIIATGRSDYPNQVNNALCFPYIFRGALDVGATTINEAMKLACVHAIAKLAMVEQSEATSGYGTDSSQSFGREYLIPKPLDPRLILEIAPAVARAAMETGVATRPIDDFSAYRQRLSEFVYNSAFIMKPVFATAKANPKRIAYAEGEDERVLRAVQVVVDEGLAKPILIGRPAVIEKRIEKLGLRIRAGKDFELVNQDDDPRFKDYWAYYHKIMERRGVSPELAQKEVRRRATLIASLLVHFGDADGMICGTFANYELHLRYINRIIPKKPGISNFSAMNVLIRENRTLFICDTYVNPDPTAEQIAEMTLLAAEEVKNFGLTPKVALLSHSSFGSENTASAQKMRKAWQLLQEMAPELEVEGEMHGDAALEEAIRQQAFPNSRLKGSANLLVMPTLDAANIAFNLLKVISSNGVTIGPILLGASKPVHILTASATVRRIINMTAVTVAEATVMASEK
ncbi:MAG: NADP-dependent malic enzyme [Moraxellaceae bacterium]|jgi:malate dehydrogenase (oxaloacetate-decarboxylating)(NADP+)|nr:NADP-dependent malic enzyme [Moraxellaceae bacterium]MBP9046309.1 NADP-dependent malic enzyme [Moraxellaceae bacterium]MBP9731063.1 NADP-dependent malic enzyme [Moraxellaceae bacterium]HQV41198.1 NADP-dependent malic enzyme [Moraxellaceae bacterium]HQX89531.1 NADP-dependent malic enzyme [Moraxellaceae bacterium]